MNISSEKMNELWFGIMMEYCNNILYKDGSVLQSQIKQLKFKSAHIGAILPFEKNNVYFRYCTIPSEDQKQNPVIGSSMALVPVSKVDSLNVTVPAAPGIYNAIMSKIPLAWDQFMKSKTSRSAVFRDVDKKVYKAEIKIHKARQAHGLFTIPLVFGTFPFFVILLSSKDTLLETLGAKFLRQMLELLAEDAERRLEEDFGEYIITPFKLKLIEECDSGDDVKKALELASDCFFNRNKYYSWISSIPGHSLNELPVQNRMKAKAKGIISTIIANGCWTNPREIVDTLTQIADDGRVQGFFDLHSAYFRSLGINISNKEHDPSDMTEQGLSARKQYLAEYFKWLTLGKFIHTIKENLHKEQDVIKAQQLYSQLKAYLCQHKNGNNVQVSYGLMRDWNKIAGYNIQVTEDLTAIEGNQSNLLCSRYSVLSPNPYKFVNSFYYFVDKVCRGENKSINFKPLKIYKKNRLRIVIKGNSLTDDPKLLINGKGTDSNQLNELCAAMNVTAKEPNGSSLGSERQVTVGKKQIDIYI